MKLPTTLKENLRLGRCIPWCGAGISVPCGLPTWAMLVQAFIDACTDMGLTSDEQNQLRYLDPEDAVEFCRDYLGENEYRTFLERTLGRNTPPNSIHHKIVSLPVPAVLTTNYDRLVENAVASRRGTIPPVLTAEDTQMLWRTMAKNEFFVLKVNGDIARPNTVVLTSRDYTRHVFGNPTFMAVVQRLILSYSILFIGSSVSDIYLRRILEESTFMAGQVGMPHFALLANVGSIRARLLRDRYNIHVISYDPSNGHEAAILDILDELAKP